MNKIEFAGNYRKSQISKINTSSQTLSLKIRDYNGNETNFLGITQKEFLKIRKILTGCKEEVDTTDGHHELITQWIANNLSGYDYFKTEVSDYMTENFSIDDFQGDLTDAQILNNLLDSGIIEFLD